MTVEVGKFVKGKFVVEFVFPGGAIAYVTVKTERGAERMPISSNVPGFGFRILREGLRNWEKELGLDKTVFGSNEWLQLDEGRFLRGR